LWSSRTEESGSVTAVVAQIAASYAETPDSLR
jgi:hypothetical protein